MPFLNSTLFSSPHHHHSYRCFYLIPHRSNHHSVNELVKGKVAAFRNKSTDNLAMPERLFAGACAGLCYWVGTFPLDAIKVRQLLTKFCLLQRIVLHCAALYSSAPSTGPLRLVYSERTLALYLLMSWYQCDDLLLKRIWLTLLLI
jgi:hypothetical protein